MSNRLLAGQESEFGFTELFFSRTNTKGIIQSGNSVFQRVSKYQWDEILKKPHNLIRHPAMPRGVFHLLWETILSERPIGAYVVNQAKDGTFYWVFALVSPIVDGFLSIRLKPNSSTFQIVQQKYVELLEVEKRKNISPKESQETLLDEIKKLGFRNYDHFMTEALTQELEARQKELKLEPIPVVSELRNVISLATKLQNRCQEIFLAYSKNAFIPLNLEIQSSRIGKEADPMAVISSQYDDIARQIQEETKKFLNAGKLVLDKVEECQFDVCNSLLQKEMFSFFKNETKETPIDKNIEMALLGELGNLSNKKAIASLDAINLEFYQFQLVYEEVQKLATAMDIVSLMGKIEAAKITHSSSELIGLMKDLMVFRNMLKNSLKEIGDIGDALISSTAEMRSALSQAA